MVFSGVLPISRSNIIIGKKDIFSRESKIENGQSFPHGTRDSNKEKKATRLTYKTCLGTGILCLLLCYMIYSKAKASFIYFADNFQEEALRYGRYNEWIQDIARDQAQFVDNQLMNRGVVLQKKELLVGETDAWMIPDVLMDMSGNGEVKWIIKYIERHNLSLETMGEKYVLDLGAYDGYYGSNSYNFLALGWNGLLVEATPNSFKKVQKTIETLQEWHDLDGVRGLQRFGEIGVRNNAVGHGEFGPTTIQLAILDYPQSISIDKSTKGHKSVDVTKTSVKDILTEEKTPKRFVFADIDVESETIDVSMDIINLGYRPYFICIETYREQTPLLDEVMTKHGYKKEVTIKNRNDIWVLQDHAKK